MEPWWLLQANIICTAIPPPCYATGRGSASSGGWGGLDSAWHTTFQTPSCGRNPEHMLWTPSRRHLPCPGPKNCGRPFRAMRHAPEDSLCTMLRFGFGGTTLLLPGPGVCHAAPPPPRPPPHPAPAPALPPARAPACAPAPASLIPAKTLKRLLNGLLRVAGTTVRPVSRHTLQNIL